MEDDSHCMTIARQDAADAVPHDHAMIAAGATDRSFPYWENDSFALAQTHDLAPRLGAGALFDKQELTAVEVSIGLAE